MLYNLDWLKPQQKFPPLSELSRLKGYKDNAKLFDDEPSLVLKPYQDRLTAIVNGLKDTASLNQSFYNIPNYWQLSTIKTVDLMIGDEPTVVCKDADKLISEALLNSDFHNKLNELVIDNDSLGEGLIRPFIDSQGKRNFTVQNPGLWFPICNQENTKEVKTDVLAWTVCIYHDANNPAKNKYELHCKIQDRGSDKVEFRRYAIPKVEGYIDYVDKDTTEHYGPQTFFVLGTMLESTIEAAPYTQLVIQIPGVTTSRSLHGISNYERITGIVAELAIRESLASFILDQNSAPRLAAPNSAFVQSKDGRWVLKTGGRNFVVAPNEQPPIYITWDGSLTANQSRIDDLKKELFALCEVGTVMSQEDMNSSQGYEALNVKLTNARLKVRRMAKAFKTPLKQLVAFLVDNSKVTSYDINIIFNDNLPVSEFQNITTAQAKKNLGVSLLSILMEYFGLTQEQAEEEIQRAREENAAAFIEQFGAVRNGDFGNNPPGKPKGDGDAKNGGKEGNGEGDDKTPDGKGKEPTHPNSGGEK